MRTSSPGVARALSLLSAFVGASLITGALGAGLFIPAVGAGGVATRNGVGYFNSLPADLSTPPLAEQSTMYASDGRTVIARFYDENRIEVPLSKIAPVMRQAIVAIEDSRFYEHGGVDAKGIIRALVNNQVNGDVQGASTLTQQYIKNYNVEKALADGDEAAAKAAVSQNYGRKLQEMRTAIALEKQLSKDKILEGYLNIALFGNNTWGVEAAAEYYFSTSASKLTLVQAATLAGLVQSPTSYSPFDHPDRAVTRRNEVLGRMFALGMINQKQYDEARTSKLVTQRHPAQNGCITALNAAYFCDYVINLLRTDPSYAFLGKTPTERVTNIKRGGYSIVTSLEVRTQQQAYKTVTDRVPITDPSRVAAVAVTVQPGTGRVLALAQNRVYTPESGQGKTQLNYGVDKLLGGSVGFATGSTFKPFTLATYLSEGKSLNDAVDASQTTRPMSDFKACGQTLHGTDYHFANAGDGEDSGAMTVQEATYRSVNTAYVDIESRVDMCDLVKTAQKLGVHLASDPMPGKYNECDNISGDGITLDYTKDVLALPYCQPSLTLGAKSIAPLTMAGAYAAFSADGKFCEPRPVISIKDRTGKAQPVPAIKCSQALDPDVAHSVTYALKKVLTQGTAAGKGIGVPAAGKTGTSDASGNTWFVGYTRSLSTAVWVADPNTYPKNYPGRLSSGQRPLHGVTIDGHYWGVVYGADIAGAIWQDYMKQAAQGRDNGDWDNPPGSMLRGSGNKVPNVIGQPIGRAQTMLTAMGYQVNVGGVTAGPAPAGVVARTSPDSGQLIADGGTITLFISDGSQGNNGNGNGNGRNRGGGGPPFPFPTINH
jgi:membrane peptidoglycan carboxypeptidase